eukprot:CAMPEP_0171172918 /NCGR_PEP_ID=MMETSP0790-20130122/9960_1 /TAXON_ID=2925 /ORGANISM="Alexandrium catenella, Strain OF101" /LENGTH=89 /DNA_ID=CAMNT_0011637777 /DNA_START=90 /DNA_END=359 /DNA_ORIENTATION=+
MSSLLLRSPLLTLAGVRYLTGRAERPAPKERKGDAKGLSVYGSEPSSQSACGYERDVDFTTVEGAVAFTLAHYSGRASTAACGCCGGRV